MRMCVHAFMSGRMPRMLRIRIFEVRITEDAPYVVLTPFGSSVQASTRALDFCTPLSKFLYSPLTIVDCSVQRFIYVGAGLIMQRKIASALRMARKSGTAIAGPARPSMPPLSLKPMYALVHRYTVYSC